MYQRNGQFIYDASSHVRSAGAECVYLEDVFASGAVGACVAVGVEVSYVLIITLCRRAAQPAVLSSRTDLLMLSPNLMWHHLTRSDGRRISRRLTAGLVQRGERVRAV